MGERWLQEIAQCARCGKCMSVCPVYIETTSEAMVARGRIALLEALAKNEVTPSPRLLRYLNSCVKCLRCQSVCPSGVRFDFIVGEGRRRVARTVSLALAARIGFRAVLPHRRLFDLFMGLARSFWGRPGPAEEPLRHLPLALLGPRPLPRLARRTALARFRRHRPQKAPKERVGFFLGCLINYVYPEVAEAVARVLESAGVEVVVPRDQLCCGAPTLGVGDEEATKTLAARNVRAFEGLDRVVVACASCSSTLKSEYEPILSRRGAEFSRKVIPFAKLAADLGLDSALVRRPTTVTWHDPCHLRSVQGVWREPRRLLAAAADYREMDLADRCCGQGGVFAYFYPDLSGKIAAHKVESIGRTEADVVATSCPGCMMQLASHLERAGSPKKVRHLAEIIAEALPDQRA